MKGDLEPKDSGLPKFYEPEDVRASIDNSRSSQQAEEMAERAKTGACPFCTLNLVRNIQLDGDIYKHWYLCFNRFPYEFHAVDILIIPKKHRQNASEIECEEWAELKAIYASADSRIKAEISKAEGARIDEASFCSVFRSGPLDGTAGTIRHLHIQIHVSSRTGPMFATFFKDKEGLMEGFIRVVRSLGTLFRVNPNEAAVRSLQVGQELSGHADQIRMHVEKMKDNDE